VRDHLKKFCFNNEVNYKIAHSLAATLNAQNTQNRSKIQPQLASEKLLSPFNSHQNYLSNSGSNFYPSSKGNYAPASSNPYTQQQERSYFNNNNSINYNNNFSQANASKENTHGSRIREGNNGYNSKASLINTSSGGGYVNNFRPVNKAIGYDAAYGANSSSDNLASSPVNSNYAAVAVDESLYNSKSVLPANKFGSNNENIQAESTFLNSSQPPYKAAIGKLNNNNNIINSNHNRSFNNYKQAREDERAGTAVDVNNPNISINIINHNYSHYFVNPEDEKKRIGGSKDAKLEKYNTDAAKRPNNIGEKYSINYQNRPPLNNMNYMPVSLQQNNKNISGKDLNEKSSKYSNINLFRSGNPNLNNSFGNTANNNNNNNINNINNPNLTRQYPDNKNALLGKNVTNNNNTGNYESYRGADLNNLDKKLLQNSRQPQQQNNRENRMFQGNNNNNSNLNNKYNSFLSEKYSSKLSSNTNRPSSAVLVGLSNSNHLSKYPITSQQIQSFISNNNNNQANNNNNSSGAYSKEKFFPNANSINNNNINSNNPVVQPKGATSNVNLGLTMIDKKNQQFREHSADPNLRSFNSGNFSGNNYINQNYIQMNNSNNNTNLINNPQKQKFGNNLTSSVNNFDMDISKNIGNRTSRPATSINENKNMQRDFSLSTPKRPVNSNLINSVNPNNININNSQGNFLIANNNNNNINNSRSINSNNPQSPNSNYGIINKSFNAMTAKDLVYEDYSLNREILIKNNFSNNYNPNMAISRSVERSKLKPSTPSYHTRNNYFSQNRQSSQNNNNNNNNYNNNVYHQKQKSENNYSSLINNFPIYTSNFKFN